MSQSKESALNVDNITGRLPETKLEYKPKSPETGYEAVYGSSRRPSATRRRRLGWCEDAHRNSPQAHSLAAATLIFASGGMNLASSVGFGSHNLYGTHVQFSWFIAVIIGSCISTLLVQKISKHIFNIVASVFVIISGVFYISATQSTSAIISARYCDGIAFGLTLIPAILAGSEQSVKRFRGFVLSAEQIGLSVGALVKLISMGNLENQKANSAHGIIALIYGAGALIFTFAFTLESPVFLLLKDFEDEAVIALAKLQRPKTVTHETYALLNENKALLEEDMNRGSSKNTSNGFIPMVKIMIFRCFVSMSISFPLTLTFLLATSLSSRNGIPMSPHIYLLMRLIGTIFSTFFLDTVGRRIPSALSLLVGGGILFSVGWLASNFWNSANAYIQPVVFLMLVYQILSGIMAASSTCYLGEAFSVSVKRYFILAIVITENMLQIVVCILVSNRSISNFACALGGMQVLYAIIYFFTMPETMQTTLREALKLFQTIFVVRTESDDEEEEEVGSPV